MSITSNPLRTLEMVRVARLERAASTSQMWRPTNWATPGSRQKKLAPFRFRLSAKTAHALLPSSSPNRARRAGLRFGVRGEETRSVPFPPFGENCTCAPSFFLSKSGPSCRASIWGTGRRNSLRSVSILEETEKRFLQSLSIIHHSQRGSKRFFPKRGILSNGFPFLSLMFLCGCVILT